MKVAKKETPELIQLFINLLWANSPKNWILKSTYFNGTLFVSMLVPTSEEQHQKIRRSFNADVISSRTNDLWGMAEDCVDEMKSNV
jgi:hypothetical protein